MLFKASAAEMNRSRASSEVRLKPVVDNGFGFFPRVALGCCDAGTKAEFEDPSSGEESVMVLSLLDSSELDSES